MAVECEALGLERSLISFDMMVLWVYRLVGIRCISVEVKDEEEGRRDDRIRKEGRMKQDGLKVQLFYVEFLSKNLRPHLF